MNTNNANAAGSSSTGSDNWLRQVSLDDDVWLQLLADNELSSADRSRYIRHLENQPDGWRRCATALLDAQVLQTALAPVDKAASRVRLQTDVPQRPMIRPLLMAACILCGTGLGWLTRGTTPESAPPTIARNVTDAPTEDAPSAPSPVTTTHVASADLTPAGLPALFQVRDDPEEAVFYADRELSQFLLDAMVLAGHRVHLEQRFRDVSVTPDRIVPVPINVLRIEKYARLVAAGDAQ